MEKRNKLALLFTSLVLALSLVGCETVDSAPSTTMTGGDQVAVSSTPQTPPPSAPAQSAPPTQAAALQKPDSSTGTKSGPATSPKEEASKPAPTPPPQPAPTPAPAPAPVGVKIISITSPAARNSSATLVAHVPPHTQASIVVHYKSGPSKAAGLEPKTAGEDGQVSWTWKVGGNTTLGAWPVTVTAGNQSAEASFEVVR